MRSSTNGLKVSLIFSGNSTLVLLTCNWTGKTSGKTQWISKLHNFRIAQSRPEKVSRYLLKSYVGSAKCRAVETFGVILHPYKDKECSNKRENVISICKWKSFNLFDFILCCGKEAKIKFMNQRLTFLEAYYHEIKVLSKSQLHNNTQHVTFIITQALFQGALLWVMRGNCNCLNLTCKKPTSGTLHAHNFGISPPKQDVWFYIHIYCCIQIDSSLYLSLLLPPCIWIWSKPCCVTNIEQWRPLFKDTYI